MGTRGALRSALVTIAVLSALPCAVPCRSDVQQDDTPESILTMQGQHRRPKSLPSRHAPRGFRGSAAPGRTAADPAVSGVPNRLPDSFFSSIVGVSRRLGCHPRDLLAVMMRESRINPRAHNRASNAGGLIQFLPGTLATLGWTGSPEGFRALNAEEQLAWVEKFLAPSSRYGLETSARVYQAIFMPASLRMDAQSATILIDKKGVHADRYARNRPLDINRDGRITVGELQKAIAVCCRGADWQKIEGRLLSLNRRGSRRGSAVAGRSARSRGSRTVAAPAEPDVELTPAPVDLVQAPRATSNEDQGERTGRRPQSADDRGGRTLTVRPITFDVPPRPVTLDGGINLRTTRGLAIALRKLGYTSSQKAMATGLRAFQRNEGLLDDGIPDEKTRAALAVRLSAAGYAAAL